MSRPKVSEMERIRNYVAKAPLGDLHIIMGWIEILVMSKGGEPPLVKRATHRRAKADAQIPLVTKEGA